MCLEEGVKDGSFRADLYYRLKVIELELPPLRDRAGDIPDLIKHFIEEIGMKLSTNVSEVSEQALALLCKYRWPGNVRELRNVIERSLVLGEGPTVMPADLPSEIAGERWKAERPACVRRADPRVAD